MENVSNSLEKDEPRECGYYFEEPTVPDAYNTPVLFIAKPSTDSVQGERRDKEVPLCSHEGTVFDVILLNIRTSKYQGSHTAFPPAESLSVAHLH